jgi:Co/Zn/Cd efflux system component
VTALADPDTARSGVLHRRIRWLVAATIAYNVVEAAVALAAGAVASSAALIGFGLDSLVEVLSAAAIAWQFAGGRGHRDREHVALRVVAFSFFGLAAVVTIEATRSLLGAIEAQPSPVGIVLAVASLVIMPTLSLLQRRAGRELGSTSVVADSTQTMICAALSAVLLVGLLSNGILGWAWADPVAALVIAAVAVREGIRALRGDTCTVLGRAPASPRTVADRCEAAPARQDLPATVRPPIACSLEAGGMAARVTDWEAALQDARDRTALGDDGVRVNLGPGVDLERLAGLLAAESRCCPFLTFTLTVGPGGDRLDVRAPAEAHEFVTALVGGPVPGPDRG